MKIKNIEEYEDWKNKNKDGYGARIFSYAEEWADMMEIVISTLDKDAAEKYANIADTDGITGYMFNASKGVLFNCWVYGDLLKYLYSDDDLEKKELIPKINRMFREQKLKRILN